MMFPQERFLVSCGDFWYPVGQGDCFNDFGRDLTKSIYLPKHNNNTYCILKQLTTFTILCKIKLCSTFIVLLSSLTGLNLLLYWVVFRRCLVNSPSWPEHLFKPMRTKKKIGLLKIRLQDLRSCSLIGRTGQLVQLLCLIN